MVSTGVLYKQYNYTIALLPYYICLYTSLEIKLLPTPY